MATKKEGGNGPLAADDLLLGIERIERLEEEKKGIADDIKDVYAEYKSKGFDTKAMREILRLRKMKPEDRREREAIVDTYKAALGMLDGTPLGRWARERLEKQDDEPADDGQDDAAAGRDGASTSPAGPTAADIDEAKEAGKAAARCGIPITSNPYPARDLRRAAWDEAWCHELGSDGMDIPDALKAPSRPKKGDGSDNGAST